jgi:hypothetical protein
MVQTREDLSFHQCTPGELEQFYPVAPAYSDVYARFRSTPTLYCLDDDMEVYGQDTTKFSRIDLNLVPCATCNVTRQQIESYLGAVTFSFMFNSPYFDQAEYGQNPIHRQSKITQFKFDTSTQT